MRCRNVTPSSPSRPALRKGMSFVAVHCTLLQCAMLQCACDTYGAETCVIDASFVASALRRRVLCCSALQAVAVCCSLLHSVAVCCSVVQCGVQCLVLQWSRCHRHLFRGKRSTEVVCLVLQCVVLCCGVVRFSELCCRLSRSFVLQRGAVCCSVLQCVALQ